jgi:hypothetical protein
MTSRKEEIKAFYDRLYRLLYVSKVSRKVVKRLLYDDVETHKRLRLSEQVLNNLWDKLYRGRQLDLRLPKPKGDNNSPSMVVKTVVKKSMKKPNKAKRGGKKMAKEVIQFDPETNKEVKRFKSARECAKETGVPYGTVTNILYGVVRNPKILIKYTDSDDDEPKQEKPKRSYNRKVDLFVKKEQDLELSKVIKDVIGDKGNENETPAEDCTTPKIPVLKVEGSCIAESSDLKLVINTEIMTEDKTKDSLDVLREAYIRRLNSYLVDEVNKLASELVEKEKNILIERTKITI